MGGFFGAMARPSALNTGNGQVDDQKSVELLLPCLEENQFINEPVEAPMAQPGNTEALSPRMWPSTPAG
jgi:hypothetical protein